MYYSIDLIKPSFASIYNAFVSDMATTAKRTFVAYEIKKTYLMMVGFKQNIDEASKENAKADLQIVNDTLVKFQGMFHTISSENEMKKDIQKVIEDLQFSKKKLEFILEEIDQKEFDSLVKENFFERLGGTDESYEPFAKMPRL